MAETITRYFPVGAAVRFGFSRGRQWATQVAVTPNGRMQRRQMWLRPKRTLKGQIYSADAATFKTIRAFLDDSRGIAFPFYVFVWDRNDFDKYRIATSFSSYPIVTPFLGDGASIVAAYKNGSTPLTGVTYDSAGPGGELRLTAGSSVSAGNSVEVDVRAARERIGVVSTTDADAFDFDWQAAIPPILTTLDLIEVF